MLGDPPAHKLTRGIESAAPLLLIFLFTLLGMVPLGLPGFSTVAPPLGLLALFYWSVHRPDLVGPGTAFACGFLTDVLTGVPLGVFTLMFLLMHGMVTAQRQLFLAHSFLILWWGFAVVALLTGLFGWLAMAALGGQLLPITPILFQTVAAIALFPLMAGLCGGVQRLMLGGP